MQTAIMTTTIKNTIINKNNDINESKNTRAKINTFENTSVLVNQTVHNELHYIESDVSDEFPFEIFCTQRD